MQTIDYDQFNFHDDVRKIVSDIKASGERFDLIIGLSRGGLIPGVVLSHNLGVPFKAINWSKNDHQVNEWVWNSIVAGKQRVLVVDDMVDTGDLLNKLFTHIESWAAFDDSVIDLTKVKLAVLINNTDVKSVYQNTTGEVTANYWGREISRMVTPNWITYWWEQQLK